MSRIVKTTDGRYFEVEAHQELTLDQVNERLAKSQENLQELQSLVADNHPQNSSEVPLPAPEQAPADQPAPQPEVTQPEVQPEQPAPDAPVAEAPVAEAPPLQ